MAAIGKIREQSTLLLIIIGGAMVAFVLGDFLMGRGGGVEERYVGEVFGEEINLVEYERRVEAQKQSMASIGQPVSSAAEQQIRNQVWNNMVQERVMYSELNKLGLRLGQDEFDDIRFGENVRSEFAGDQNFKDPETGQFDPKLVQNYFSFLQQQYPMFYETQVNRVVNERLYEKYNNLVKKGLYVNTLEAKDEYYRQETELRFNYVVRDYSSLADSLVDVSEAELKAYYNEHEDDKRFEKEAAANINFVVFDVEPTEEDEAAIREDLESLKSEFRNAKNDSLFVLKNSVGRNANLIKLNAAGNEELQAQIENAAEGDVVGPYKSGNRYAIAKVVNIGTEEQATVRHILLSNQTGTDMETLKSRADSIVQVIRRENNFEEMVTKFSDDPGSVEKGGKYENFNRETMVEEFTEASFEEPIGSLNVIETTYGVHIVEPLERKEAKVVEGYVVDEDIYPSNQTFNEVYDEANQFSIDAEDAEDFESLAKERGYEVSEGREVSTQSRNIPGVTNSVEAVRWAHNTEQTKVGDVSQPFEFDRKIVVASLESRRKAGKASFEDVKEEIEPEVIREKKVDMFKKEMEGKDLDQLKNEFGLQIKLAANVTPKRPSLSNGANEPYVVGYAESMKEEALSPPLEGNMGVYVLKLESKSAVEPRESYATYQDELKTNRESSLRTYTSGTYRALKEMANVKDERTF